MVKTLWILETQFDRAELISKQQLWNPVKFSVVVNMPSSDPLLLYTAASPNGECGKMSILLEELKDAYGLEYAFRNIDIRINPNGRIPALVDPSRDGFIVFESAAIVLYLAQATRWYRANARASRALLPVRARTDALPTVFGPITHPHVMISIKVLNERLSGREYLVGPGKGRYGLADINAFPWIRAHRWAGVENLNDYPHIQAWLDRIYERPQAKRGLDVPDPTRANMTKEEEEKLIASVQQWMFGPKGR
ncbi:hypothetical protein AG1IA_07770 [Rhizoctonia solani AG-1 IA]|uniref:Glutathione S-transferase n=1 Tax=Thanatephorus cucumeris (strain AG1-IA) TaxID=983506 RepID=L8WJ06_THACA|nr:hypothetical protein AG1IA_07770 [Rhizoctonia solani AG-1 IA]